MAKILVVDDDKIILKILEATLSTAGYTVVSASDGHDAFEALCRESFDLVILDVNMPGGVSGFHLTKAIRAEKKWSHLGVMLLTGRRDKTDVARALKAGVDDYLIKPLDTGLLLAKIEALLAKHKGIQAFTEIPTSTPGTWTLDIVVTGISEQSLSFISPYEPPPNTIFKISASLFDEVKISPPNLRLISSIPVDGSPRSFQISVSLVGQSASELKSLRVWMIARNHVQRKVS